MRAFGSCAAACRRAAQVARLWWRMLGCNLAYAKGQMGERVELIGAEVTADVVRAKVTVRIPASKVEVVVHSLRPGHDQP